MDIESTVVTHRNCLIGISTAEMTVSPDELEGGWNVSQRSAEKGHQTKPNG